MKKFMTRTFRMLAFGMLSLSLVLSSCKDDNNDDNTNPTPTFSDPTIAATAGQSQAAPGDKVTFTIAVAAEAGLASVKQGDTDVKTYTDSKTTDVISYEYTVPDGQAEGPLQLTFTVTDKQSTAKTASGNASITVTAHPTPTITIDAPISAADAHWTADNFYVLKGNIYVEDGAELTIDPGTVIFGDKVTKGALIVSRGGKIHAKGTAEAPIIFTSSAPVNFRNYGDWGGVVLLGHAQNNQSHDQKIEGISAADGDNGLYGGDGTTDDDSSGEFYYVRIEFAGIALSTDNELNGLTFGGVGSGTEVHHVQVSFSGDDSYEWFGGAVNTKYLVAFRGWDDEFDTDFGHHGKHQFLVSFRDPDKADKSGSNGFESDNDAAGDANLPQTAPIFSNVSFMGPFVYANVATDVNTGVKSLNPSNVNGNYKNGAHIRRNSGLQVYNSIWVGANITGILFDKPNDNAVVMNNYIGRITGNAKATSTGTTYDVSTFETNNTVENPLNLIDLSDKIAGLSLLGTLTAPTAMLAAESPFLTAGIGMDDSYFEDTDYIGAFDDTNNWMEGWTNFDPNTTDYTAVNPE